MSSINIFFLIRSERTLRLVALSLLWVFIALTTAHLTLALGARYNIEYFQSLWENGVYRLDADNSVSEYVEYTLLSASAFFMTLCWKLADRSKAYAMLAAVNIIFLADGLFHIHERAGMLSVSFPFWMGELIYFAFAGALICIVVFFALSRSPSKDRIRSLPPLFSLAAAALCGIFIDFFHSIVSLTASNSFQYYLREALAVVEDGGELLFIITNFILTISLYFRILKE